MVVSRDWQEVSVLECILGGLHMEVAVEQEPQRAFARISKSKIDALIIDCDLNGSTQLLRDLHASQKQAPTVPLVIMGRPQSVGSLEEMGAMFAFEKPISVEQAVRTLSAARSMILDGRLRYHRTSMEVPVWVKSKGQRLQQAHLVNLSQRGMQIHAGDPIVAGAPLQISFELPGSHSKCSAQAEIVWRDEKGNFGLHFVKVAPDHQRSLRIWLAQQFLVN